MISDHRSGALLHYAGPGWLLLVAAFCYLLLHLPCALYTLTVCPLLFFSFSPSSLDLATKGNSRRTVFNHKA